jgi:RimJ/RimL family protein N-acetyltransferase
MVYDGYFWHDDLVRLRAIRLDDWRHHYDNRFDTAGRLLVDYLVELPPTESEAVAFAEEFADFRNASRRVMFSIENHDGELVGGLNLNSIDERNGTFSIGIQIDRGQRGKGYGTAAMRMLLRYAFEERRLHKFNVGVLEGNLASSRMMETLGCTKEGVRRQVVYSGGRYFDEILFGMTAREFANPQGRK